MRFHYHDAHDRDFEDLVVELCRYLLGIGVQKFSSGPDGGRDARFEGTAERWPSTSKPHAGKFVIQAKHTQHPWAKTGDSGFSSETDKNSVLSKELPKIAKLVANGELDHYLLFANRKNAGGADERIRKRILTTGVKSATVFGVEDMDDLVKVVPAARELADRFELRGPLNVTPEALAEVVLALVANPDAFAPDDSGPVERVSMDDKNRINNLSKRMDSLIRRTYMKDFLQVRRFLGHPDNAETAQAYSNAAIQFNELFVAHGRDGQVFDELLVNLHRRLLERDSDLASNVKVMKLVTYYMYWNCDLGEGDE